MNQTKTYYRNDLQGLRAIAILLIILSHSSLGIFKGGFIGVDVFFVLSGFLITRLLANELNTTRKIHLTNFYASRLRRLLPALIFMILMVFGIGFLLLSKTEFYSQISSISFSPIWVSNFYFAFRSIDYFNELATQDLYLHTWSLGVEEQFYLFWPLLLIYLYRRNKKFTNKATLELNLAIIFIICLLISIYWTLENSITAFYLMPSRIWQFSLGALIYFHLNKTPANINKGTKSFQKSILFSIGILCIFGSALLFSPNLVYPGYWAIIPSLGSALVIFAEKNNKNILSHPILVWIGDHSYSLYLWHWPIFTIGFSLGYKGQIIPVFLMFLISVLISILSLKYIEKPFWKHAWSKKLKPRLVICSVLPTKYSLKREINSSLETSIYKNWGRDLPDIYKKYKCDDWYLNSQIIDCQFCNINSDKIVFLLGDSILAQWFSTFEETFISRNWNMLVLTKSARPLVDEDLFYSRIRKNYQVCTDWKRKSSVLKKLKEIKPTIIIMGNAATYDFTKTQWKEGSSRTIENISNLAKNVILIPGTPKLSFNGPDCLRRNTSKEGIIDYERCVSKDRISIIQPVVQILSNISLNYSNVHFLNLNDLVCPNGDCYASTKSNIAIFRDQQHLTDTFVREKTEAISKIFEFWKIIKHD